MTPSSKGYLKASAHRVAACLLISSAVHAAGIIVSRSDQGFQFTDAFAISVNGKDKALSLGNQPKLSTAVNRLQSVKLGDAMLLDADSNTPALFSETQTVYLLPDGLKNPSGDPAVLWQSVKITYKKAQSDKTHTEIPVASFVAFLPGGVEELARLCMDERGLQLVGGKNKAFAAQLQLTAATIKSYGSDPATASLGRYVTEAVRQPYEQFENGSAGVDALERSLKFVELSNAAFPNNADQKKLRDLVVQRKAWLDRKIAVLKALAASGQWDAFLLGDRDFERYQQAFPDMMQRHSQALKQSLLLHTQAGKSRMADAEYGPAYREFRLASSRQPSDTALQKQVSEAWTDYSVRVAQDNLNKRKQLTPGQKENMDRALLYATRYKEQKKLDDALKSVQDAEAVDPEALPVLLKKAEVLGAMFEASQALKVLDEYDLRAVETERKPANDLRNDLMFTLTSALKDMKAEVAKAMADRKFHLAHDLALKAMLAKDDDPDLLYNAAMSALITRNTAESRRYLARYLEVSNTLDANDAQRVRARQSLHSIADPAPEQGEPNWMSGKRLPKGVFYDPVSLAFQARIDHIEASNKLKVNFEWQGTKLAAITPVFDRNEAVTPEKKIVFGYDGSQVAWTGSENEKFTPAAGSPDEAVRRSQLVVLNNRYVDPAAIQKVTGQNVTVGIAGNRVFNPFVWEKIYFFRFTYDGQGRVQEAREITDKGAPGTTRVVFDWEGMQLARIRAYSTAGPGDGSGTMFYERRLQYQNGQLMSEDIRSQGKTAHITYAYNNDGLASATCDKDESLDRRSRQAFFMPPAR